MVCFDNITNNQRVEVKRKGCVYTGTVKYKGGLNAIPGDWVGVELDVADGNHDGMLNGRRYFFCQPDHGIFTVAENIRFIPMKRGAFQTYRKVNNYPDVEEILFTKPMSLEEKQRRLVSDKQRRAGWIQEGYGDKATQVSDAYLNYGAEPRRYHLHHSLDKDYIYPANALRPHTAKARLHEPRGTLYVQHGDNYPEFCPSPSIPHVHRPEGEIMRRQRETYLTRLENDVGLSSCWRDARSRKHMSEIQRMEEELGLSARRRHPPRPESLCVDWNGQPLY